ncbi:hypothetical protein SAMN05443550_108219 [Pedobacter hartonius]|uniref:Uncharacterized protein n=1 Tax=Pedobacter hartonius TaxID=425514 RepID=A0A1H4FZW2_9SPHI|nr:hypothetical protein SAMN05443550_108219 [Pedobacter hartonius]
MILWSMFLCKTSFVELINLVHVLICQMADKKAPTMQGITMQSK